MNPPRRSPPSGSADTTDDGRTLMEMQRDATEPILLDQDLIDSRPLIDDPAPERKPFGERFAEWRKHYLPLPDEVIDEYLGEDEYVVHTDHPSFRAFLIQNVVLVLVVSIVGPIFVYLASGGITWTTLLLFLGLDIVLLYMAIKRLQDRYVSYVITNLRLIRLSGVFGRRLNSIPWTRMTGLGYFQNPLGRILGYATILIESANEESGLRRFSNINDPATFHQRILDLVSSKTGQSVGGKPPPPTKGVRKSIFQRRRERRELGGANKAAAPWPTPEEPDPGSSDKPAPTDSAKAYEAAAPDVDLGDGDDGGDGDGGGDDDDGGDGGSGGGGGGGGRGGGGGGRGGGGGAKLGGSKQPLRPKSGGRRLGEATSRRLGQAPPSARRRGPAPPGPTDPYGDPAPPVPRSDRDFTAPKPRPGTPGSAGRPSVARSSPRSQPLRRPDGRPAGDDRPSLIPDYGRSRAEREAEAGGSDSGSGEEPTELPQPRREKPPLTPPRGAARIRPGEPRTPPGGTDAAPRREPAPTPPPPRPPQRRGQRRPTPPAGTPAVRPGEPRDPRPQGEATSAPRNRFDRLTEPPTWPDPTEDPIAGGPPPDPTSLRTTTPADRPQPQPRPPDVDDATDGGTEPPATRTELGPERPTDRTAAPGDRPDVDEPAGADLRTAGPEAGTDDPHADRAGTDTDPHPGGTGAASASPSWPADRPRPSARRPDLGDATDGDAEPPAGRARPATGAERAPGSRADVGDAAGAETADRRAEQDAGRAGSETGAGLPADRAPAGRPDVADGAGAETADRRAEPGTGQDADRAGTETGAGLPADRAPAGRADVGDGAGAKTADRRAEQDAGRAGSETGVEPQAGRVTGDDEDVRPGEDDRIGEAAIDVEAEAERAADDRQGGGTLEEGRRGGEPGVEAEVDESARAEVAEAEVVEDDDEAIEAEILGEDEDEGGPMLAEHAEPEGPVEFRPPKPQTPPSSRRMTPPGGTGAVRPGEPRPGMPSNGGASARTGPVIPPSMRRTTPPGGTSTVRPGEPRAPRPPESTPPADESTDEATTEREPRRQPWRFGRRPGADDAGRPRRRFPWFRRDLVHDEDEGADGDAHDALETLRPLGSARRRAQAFRRPRFRSFGRNRRSAFPPGRELPPATDDGTGGTTDDDPDDA